jgi:hypothetical protein
MTADVVILLASGCTAVSAVSGVVAVWMADAARRHAATSAAGASFVAQSLRPPADEPGPNPDHQTKKGDRP